MPTSRNPRRAAAYASLLIVTVIAANLLVTYAPPVPIGFGFFAPAGVLVAGLAFTIRDLLDDAGGRWWVLGSILTGALVSLAMGSGRVAIAGAAAYLVSETADWLVYRAVHRRGRIAAVAASGAVGLLLDSIVFLTLAFGSLLFLPGQILGKLYALAASVAVLAVLRRRELA